MAIGCLQSQNDRQEGRQRSLDSEFMIVLLATLFGLSLRLFRLGSQSFWIDECNDIQIASQPIGRDLLIGNVTAPLYNLFLHFWHPLWPNEAFVRLPTALFGALSIPIIYKLGKELFDKNTAGVACLLFAVSPFHIWYSQVARVYTWTIFFSLVSMLFFVRLLKERSAKRWVVYILSSALGILCHYGMVYILLAQTLYLLIYFRRHRAIVVPWFIVQAVIFIGVFLPLFVFQYLPAVKLFAVVPFPRREFSILWIPYIFFAMACGFSLGPSTAELHGFSLSRDILPHIWVLLPAGLVFCALGLRGLVRAGKEPHNLIFLMLYLVLPIVLAIVSVLKSQIPFNVRYVSIAWPAFVLLIALGGSDFASARWKTGLVCAVVFLSLFAVDELYFNPRFWKEDARGCADFIRDHWQPNDVIVGVSPYFTRTCMVYYLPDKQVISFPDVTKVPVTRDVAEELPRAVSAHSRMWLVLSRLYEADPEGWTHRICNEEMRILQTTSFPGVELALYQIKANSTQ